MINHLEDLFSDEIIEKAREMAVSGKVKKPEWGENDELFLKVRDDRNYSTMIDVDGNGYLYGLKCSCGDGAVRKPCVHMAASWLYYEAFTGERIRYEDEYCVDLNKDDLPDFENNAVTGEASVERQLSRMFDPAALKGDVCENRKDTEGEQPPESACELTELEELQGNTRAQRSTDEAYASDKPPEDYNFFRFEEYDSSVVYEKKLLKDAETLIREIESFDVETGYSDSRTGAQEMIGNALAKGKSERSFYHNWEARISFSKNRILGASCRTWGCNTPRYEGTSKVRLCEHTLAAYLCLKGYLKHNHIGDSTNASAGRLFEYITKNRNENDTDTRVRDLKLEPVINMYENDYQSMYLTFRTGIDKLYVIKDLSEYVDNVEAGNEYTFGKNSTIRLEKSRLTDDALIWYDFLAEQNTELQRAGRLADSLRSSGRSYYSGYREYRYTLGKELYLRRDVLDRFFEAGNGKMVEVKLETDRGGKRQLSYKLSEHSLPLRLEICADKDDKTGEFRGILIKGDTPETFSGLYNTYYINDNAFVRVNSNDNALVRSLLNEESGGYIRLQVGRSHLLEFYKKILPVLRTVADITEYDTDEIKSYIPPEPEYAFFMDVIDGDIICRADVYYGSNAYSLTDVIHKENGVYVQYDRIRNEEDESRVMDRLYDFLPQYDPVRKVVYCEKDDETVFRLLDHGLDELMELGEVYTTERFKRLIVRKDVKFTMGVSVESNLMNLEITSDELSREELMEIFNGYRRKQNFVKLKSGDFVKLDPDNNLAMLNQMLSELNISLKDFVKGKMHIPAYRALYLDKSLEVMQGIYANRDKQFKTLIREFSSIDNSDFELPEDLRAVMRNYQQLGYKWLRTLDHYGFGGILADDMGLGKTLQIISVIKSVRNEEAAGPSLVVCPASLVYNWGEEIKRFAPDLRYTLILGAQDERHRLIDRWQEADILVTSYDLLKRDIAFYDGMRFRFQIIDEAQYIKNHNTEAAKTVKLISADTKFALTGTPIENRLSELWSIFDYLMPGLLYKYGDFRSRFETPIVKYDDKAAMETLTRMVHPFILRRVKKDVLKDLPNKLDEIRYAGMDNPQRKLYDAQVLRMRKKVDKKDDDTFNKSKIEILAELTRIRQICCDPSLCFGDYKGGSAKLEACMDLINSLIDGGHKTLLFSQFTSMLEIIEEELKKAEISYYKITGSTPKEARLEMVNKFNEDKTPLFLISLKAGGTGLNLTGADSVIHYDPWWNIAAQNQATDRAHRIGQTKIVTVYRLIVKNTIEEKILLMQEQKSRLAQDILSGENVSNVSLTKEDLMLLLE